MEQPEIRTIYERAEDIGKIIEGILELGDDLDSKLSNAIDTIDELEETIDKKDEEIESLNRDIEDLKEEIKRLEADL